MKVLMSGHKSCEAEVVEVDQEVAVAEVVETFVRGGEEVQVEGVSIDIETDVWLVDADTPLDPSRTLLEHQVEESAELVITRHKTPVAVTVHFVGPDHERTFGRQRSMQRVYDWAVGPQGFNLAADQRAQHELAVVGSREAVDLRLPLAAYVPDGHAVGFNLRRKKGYQG